MKCLTGSGSTLKKWHTLFQISEMKVYARQAKLKASSRIKKRCNDSICHREGTQEIDGRKYLIYAINTAVPSDLAWKSRN